jgi:Holliday junction resolvase RusA-like endonuclease
MRISQKDFDELVARGAIPDEKPKPRKPGIREWRNHYAAVQFPLHERSFAADRVREILLPLPPSLNHYRVVLRGRLATSAQGRAYLENVCSRWRELWHGHPPPMLTERLRVMVVCSMSRAGVSDLDARWKALLDGMKEAQVYRDDGLIDDERMIRGPVYRPDGYVKVRIETIGQPMKEWELN